MLERIIPINDTELANTVYPNTFFLPIISPNLEIQIDPTSNPKNIKDPNKLIIYSGAHTRLNLVIQLDIVYLL